MTITLDQNLLTSPDTVLRESLLRAYSFTSAREQLEMTEKVFSIKLDENIRMQIKKHTLVRNSLEHHGGLIRDKDLSDLGAREIVLTDPSGKPKAYHTNDRLRVEVWDIEELVVMLEAAAREFN